MNKIVAELIFIAIVFRVDSAYSGLAVQAEEPMTAKGDISISSKGLAR